MNIWFTLHMDLTNPEGPGWYLSATRKDGVEDPVVLIPPTRIGLGASQMVSRALDDAVPITILLPVMPTQIVDSGVVLIGEALKEQINLAKEAASRVAKLEALQEAESTTDKDVDRNDL